MARRPTSRSSLHPRRSSKSISTRREAAVAAPTERSCAGGARGLACTTTRSESGASTPARGTSRSAGEAAGVATSTPTGRPTAGHGLLTCCGRTPARYRSIRHGPSPGHRCHGSRSAPTAAARSTSTGGCGAGRTTKKNSNAPNGRGRSCYRWAHPLAGLFSARHTRSSTRAQHFGADAGHAHPSITGPPMSPESNPASGIGRIRPCR